MNPTTTTTTSMGMGEKVFQSEISPETKLRAKLQSTPRNAWFSVEKIMLKAGEIW